MFPYQGSAIDSRQVEKGNCFVALVGTSTDGHKYIQTAIQNGAAAIIGSQPGLQLDVPYIQVEDTRHTLALISAAFYGFPARSYMRDRCNRHRWENNDYPT